MRVLVPSVCLCFSLVGLGCGDAGSSSSDPGGSGGHADGAGGEGATTGTGAGGEGAAGSGGMDEGGAAPQGVEAFVAVGWGGRRLASCDGGMTWIGDVEAAPESDDDWHKPYTPKHLAYGDGRFVFLTGWGNDSTVHVSTDGVSWTSTQLSTTYGGVGHDGARFLLVGNRELAESTDEGLTWPALTDPKSTYDRAAAAFAGVMVAGADGNVETLREGTNSWQPLASCQGTRHGHIGFQGGFAAGGGILLSLGHDGDTCAMEIATGNDLGAGTINAPVRFRPSYFDGAFQVATGDTLHQSSDGVSWTSTPIQGAQLHQIVKGPGGHYVGLNESTSDLYYSADGSSWTQAQAPDGNGFLYLAAGALDSCGP
ncbi:MAG: hypothetical protein R3B72_50740 [Polyangiaceae bacterium]